MRLLNRKELNQFRNFVATKASNDDFEAQEKWQRQFNKIVKALETDFKHWWVSVRDDGITIRIKPAKE